MAGFFVPRSLAHVSRHAVVPILNLREPAVLVVAFPNQPTRRRTLGATAIVFRPGGGRFLDFADQRETCVLKMMLLVFEFLIPRANPAASLVLSGPTSCPRCSSSRR
jgi:hypothetical protein